MKSNELHFVCDDELPIRVKLLLQDILFGNVTLTPRVLAVKIIRVFTDMKLTEAMNFVDSIQDNTIRRI